MFATARKTPGAEADNGSDSEIAKGPVRNHPARAMYDQIEDALTSITMQLRSHHHTA